MSAADPEPRWRRLGPDERRSDILAAAVRAFGELPYDAVQLDVIARDAGVARGLVHHYFGTKRSLYLDVVRAMMMVPSTEEVRLPDGSLRERVEASVAWLTTVLAEHGRTWVRVGASGVGADAEVQAILDEADDRAAEWVLETIGFVGNGRDREVALAAVRAFGGLVKASMREWIDKGTLTEPMVRTILTETLVALADEALPRIT